MKQLMARGSLSVLVASAAIWIAVLSPQAQAPSAASGQGPAMAQQPPAGAPQEPGAPAPPQTGPGQGRGRGGRGGLGGPGADDPANASADYSPKDPVLPLSPEEQAKKFWLPAGYRLEPVLSDPVIQESAQVAFDGNGRMFVLELRTYMQDADAFEELAPISRISMHEDRDNDGKYEHHTVFVDKLVFPRFVMPFGAHAVLTMDSNADEVWKYTDTNNDGVADKKDLFATGFGRLANVEHQQASLFWAMDNWMYSTVNAFRVRWTPNGLLREPTGSNNSQWGATQDNYGKVWFQGGASGMPGYFQFPVHYGNFQVPDQFEPNLNITWGAPVLVADMQGGLPAVRLPDGSLARATGAAGNDIFRGDRLPRDLVGDLLYGETVARIVRRLRPVKTEGLTQLRNVYPLSEFIRSTDPLFRPVDMTTAPDGTLYITDMYRGIIQQATWSGRGTYLRKKIEQYQLDKVVKHGRIWRLTYEGMPRDRTQPRMLNETPAQLVAHLSHPNGWWRDTAQQLLVLEQDKSVVPALQRLAARTNTNQLARIHAIWTLEGLGALDAAAVREHMKDPDPQIRSQAIRASETLYKAGDRTFAAEYRALSKDADAGVAIQAMLTAKLFNLADLKTVVESAQAANRARGVQEIGRQILSPTLAAGRGGGGRGGPPPFTPDQAKVVERGETIYKELCFTCHGPDGRGAPQEGGAAGVTMAPSLASSPRVQGHRDYVIKTLLHGMTGPVDGKTYPAGVMIPVGANSDEWIAAIASYVRNSFGNRAPFVTPADVARVRAATSARKTLWTLEELLASLPQQLLPDPSWVVTASHNTEAASGALTFTTWRSGVPQQPGMWFQIELPREAMLTEIQFESPGQGGRGGGAGRGGAPSTGSGQAGRGGAAPQAAAGAAGMPQAEPAPPAATAPGAPAPNQPGGGRAAGPGDFTPPATPPSGFPRGYRVEVSTDGKRWSAPIAEGVGAASTVIPFTPVRAKFVRITQTAAAEGAPPWTIQRLRLFEARQAN